MSSEYHVLSTNPNADHGRKGSCLEIPLLPDKGQEGECRYDGRVSYSTNEGGTRP